MKTPPLPWRWAIATTMATGVAVVSTPFAVTVLAGLARSGVTRSFLVFDVVLLVVAVVPLLALFPLSIGLWRRSARLGRTAVAVYGLLLVGEWVALLYVMGHPNV